MKIKRNPLFVPILWSLVTACWLAVLCIDFYYKSTSKTVVILHALTAGISLLTTILNYLNYRNRKGQFGN